MAKPEFDLCVIGGGAGGLVVAAGAATLGAKVALIEKHRLGGDCLYYGCVPSKTLLHSAKVAHLMRGGARFGLEPYAFPVRLDRVMQRVQSVIKTIEPHDSPERFCALGVEVLFGQGQFTDPRTFTLNRRPITAKRFVLATGSRPALPTVAGLENLPYLTNETVFALKEPVPSLIILGAGPIGMEMAQAFARLGSRVVVVECSERVLPREDSDLADALRQRLAAEGIEFLLNHTPLQAKRSGGDIHLQTKAGDGRVNWLEASHLLLATGRPANVEGLGLEAAGVQVINGRVLTDRRLRTSNKIIYACGDVTGPYPFTHMAEHQAGVILRNALLHLPATVEQRVIPWCTFTDPELARVGLSEDEARIKGIPYKTYRFPFAEIDRAQAEDETAGFAKVLTTPRGRLLGAMILGPHAGELIHEYSLALSQRLNLSDISGVIHIYPTLAQINRRVADQALKERLTPRTKKWMQRLFRLRGG